MKNLIKQSLLLVFAIVLFFAALLLPSVKTFAVTAGPVGIKNIDYENFIVEITPNKNEVVHYSTNDKTWIEVEEDVSGNETIYMDISWISLTSDITLYLKGSEDKTVVSVELPKRNNSIKVKFNKVDGNLEFSGCDEASEFQWRKSTDYTWYTVPMNETTEGHKEFLKTVNNLTERGTKIMVRTAQKKGNATDPGLRPSKQVSVTITKRANAPALKINLLSLTVNTKDTMEYLGNDGKWVACDKNMELKKLIPDIEKVGAKNLTVKVRTAETDKKAYSKTAILQVNAQEIAPTVGDSTKEVTYYLSDNKLILQFNKATATDLYEYSILKPGVSSLKRSWKSVRKPDIIKISNSTAPKGSTIYVRKKGVTANARKDIQMMLPSLTSSFIVP